MKRFALVASLVSLCMLVHGMAQAQSWFVETELVPNPATKCPDVPVSFEVTVAGAGISLKNAIGNVYTGTVGGDGAVSLQYNSPSGLGTVVVTGNASAKSLNLTAPRSLPGCVYTLKPIAGGTAESTVQWKATIQQVSGNLTTCSPGSRGGARITGNALFVFGFARPEVPFAAVRLAADGSADIDATTAFGRNARARFKVPPGAGPRQVDFVTYSNVCGYRMIPD